MLEESSRFGPICGIFNLAAVFMDRAFANQTPDSFQQSLAPKADSARYIDELTRSLCPELEHFVVFSSIASGRGSAGQTNYGMSNSVLDRIVEDRRRNNLPAKSIQWGPISDIGLVSRITDNDNTVEVTHCSQQRPDRCFRFMDALLYSKSAIVSSIQVPHKRTIQEDNTLTRILRVFGIKNVTKVPTSSTLADLGIDSLVISEVKQILELEAKVTLSTVELEKITIEDLKRITGSE